MMSMSITRTSLTRAFFRNSFLEGHKGIYKLAQGGSGDCTGVCVSWDTIPAPDFSYLSPESRIALSLSPGQVEVLAHDRDVPPPGLVQGEHPQSRLSL